MNTIGISLYVVSVIIWWAGFNYAATRTESPTRRKLFSTAAALALAWPFAFIALAGALATKAAANLMIAVGNHINNTWDAAVSDPDDNAITVLTPMGTAVRVRRENTERSTDTANSGHEDGNTDTTTSEEAHQTLADNTPLMPPPPPPTVNETNSDTAAETTTNDAESDVDETVTIQKVSLSEII